MVSIDGRHLFFSGTGLALEVSERLLALDAAGHAEETVVFIEDETDLSGYGLSDRGFHFVRIKRKRWTPDYVDRWFWGRAVWCARKKMGVSGRHFIPYLYNYGAREENVVMVPDLLYHIYPIYGMKDPSRAWWNFRGRLPFRPAVMRWEEKIVSRAKVLTVNSRFVMGQAQSILGVPRGKITLLPMGVPSWVQKAGFISPEIKSLLPSRFVLYTGGYASRKNVPFLMRVIREVVREEPSFRCVCVGLPVAEKNSDLAEALNNDEAARAVVGLPRLDYGALAAVYGLAEFTLYPSLCEGYGLPVLESAARKKICLCGDNSSLVEIQPDSRFRLPDNHCEAWKEAVLHWWRNPVLCRNEGEKCSDPKLAFSPRASADKLWDLLVA